MENWIKDFNAQFKGLAPFCLNPDWEETLEKIKFFIRQLIKQKKKEIKEKIISIKSNYGIRYCTCGNSDCQDCHYEVALKTIDDVLKNIENLL
jgi:hypothetical protein